MRKQEFVKAVVFMAIGGCTSKVVQVIKSKRPQKEITEDEL
jgi:hypothetical protein